MRASVPAWVLLLDWQRFECAHGRRVTERCERCARGPYGRETRPSQMQRSWDLLAERTDEQLRQLAAAIDAND